MVAMLAAPVGVVALTPGSASATPAVVAGHYPPVKPAMVVNKGTVKKGQTVKATGRQYKPKEKVLVTVYFTPKNSHKTKIVKKIWVRANKKGKFSVHVRMLAAGRVVIKGKGLSSGKSAAATVWVVHKKKGHNGGWVIKPASFGTPGGTSVVTPVSAPADDMGYVLAGFGALALIGSAAVTGQTIRRRRRLNAAA
ncbi:MAG TPA: hypothetical protein VFO77_09840, partial [Actinoplanes sp.]|nr:hypothetical protein [Actinoplanes sp.]